MLPIEAAWVGAMVEAEGCISVDKRRITRLPRISVANTDVEIISTLMRLVGDGYVRMSRQTFRKDGQPCRPAWEWNLTAMAAVLDLIPQIAPYMTTKGEIAMSLLDIR